ncbi:hypothetical protein [Anoxynatronum sibiricum]|uniref:Endolytic transglycosylase MltG n=1 Tax=Anoxynatronum sibiricum TaxID=210623 RepID=A0ABU9VRK6_9CLOT
MDRLKDFLHDYSDVFLATLIIIAMVSVVYVNLNTIFDDNPVVMAQPAPGGSTADAGTGSDLPLIVELPSGELEDNELPPEEMRHEDDASEEGADATPADDAPSTPSPMPSAPPAPGETVEITIPNGTPGIGIAQILVDHQLLPDTTSFVRAAETLELSLKLKSGTFQIPAGSSPEEMVRIIAGQ